MEPPDGARRLTRFRRPPRRAPFTALLGAAAALATCRGAAFADEPFNVCSITINSDDELRTFRRRLPESEFRFIELTDWSRAAGASSWFTRACNGGVRCDVLLLSAHFGNTWAGNYGTTFAGSSGVTLSLRELEERRCDDSCPGILADPLEVFLLGCKTLAGPAEAGPPSSADGRLLAEHHVSTAAAAHLVDEAVNHGEPTSSRERMRFVFAGVPHLYGFTDVAPAGPRAAPLLDDYLATVGDYAEHLRRLALKRSNGALARSLARTCFTESRGLESGDAEFARDARLCALRDEGRSPASRLGAVERLADLPDLASYIPAIDAFFRAHGEAVFEPAARDALERIRRNDRARATVRELASALEEPVFRLEVVRLGRFLGWLTSEEALSSERQIVVRLLRPPMWADARDLVCGMGAEVLRRVALRADEVPAETYENEFGIQALGCLRPEDPEIRVRLARSRTDRRPWIAALAAEALDGMTERNPTAATIIAGTAVADNP